MLFHYVKYLTNCTVTVSVYAKFSLNFLNFIKKSLNFKIFIKTFKIFNKIFEISSNFSQNTVTFLIYPKCFTFSQKFENKIKNFEIFLKSKSFGKFFKFLCEFYIYSPKKFQKVFVELFFAECPPAEILATPLARSIPNNCQLEGAVND